MISKTKLSIVLSMVAMIATAAYAAEDTPADTTMATTAASKKIAKRKKHKKKKEAQQKAEQDAANVQSPVDNGGAQTPAEPTFQPSKIALPANQTSVYDANGSQVRRFFKSVSGSLAAETYSDIGGLSGVNHHTADWETDYELKMNYKIDDRTSVSVYNEYDHLNHFNNQGQPAREWEGYQDPYIGLTKSDVLKNNAGITVDTQARVFLPLSSDSVMRDQITQLRLYGIASKDLTPKLNLSLMLSPRFFVGTKDTYVATDGVTRATDEFRFASNLGLKYSFNDVWAIEQTAGVINMWYNSAAARGISHSGNSRSDYLQASTSVYYTPVKWIMVNAGVRQDQYGTDLMSSNRGAQANAIYGGDQAEYFLITSFSLN